MADVWSQIKRSSPIKLTLAALAIGAAWTFLGGSPETKKRPVKQPAVSRSVSSGAATYTDADYKSHFAVYELPVKDAFKPVIARKNVSGDFEAGKDNGVPPYMAGGDANWIYTGTAEVDGVPMALIENTASSDGVYLTQGEHWKDLIVERILADSVIIRGSDGETLTLRLAAPVSDEEVKPLTPPLQGDIGGATVAPGFPRFGNMTLSPEAQPATEVPVPPSAGSGGGRGRNQRNRSGSG